MATYEELARNLMDNRVLFLHLLKENTAAKFHEILAECPMRIHMCCGADVHNVSL